MPKDPGSDNNNNNTSLYSAVIQIADRRTCMNFRHFDQENDQVLEKIRTCKNFRRFNQVGCYAGKKPRAVNDQ